MENFAKPILLLGGIIFLFGVILMFWGKISCMGRLPGDIVIEKGNFKFYFPVATSILASLIFTIILWLIQRIRGD